MPVDLTRLMAGLDTATSMITDEANLSAVDVIVTAMAEATGAAGATFTEYGPEGGRVVVATGTMGFALGQPISGEFIDTGTPDQAIAARIESLPVQIAEPLLSRDVHLLVGRPVQTFGRVVGALHLYFHDVSFQDVSFHDVPFHGADFHGADFHGADFHGAGVDLLEPGDEPPGPDEAAQARRAVPAALRISAAAIAHLYCGARAPARLTLADEDNRTLFLAVAGHELRTPVTVLKGYASMLAERWDSLDDAARRDAARVLTQRADELARLVDRLLGASVGDAAMGWVVRQVPFDLIGALLRAVGDLPSELRRDVRLELPNSLPLAGGDPTILASIVAELVTNAVRNTAVAATRSVGPGGVGDPSSQGDWEAKLTESDPRVEIVADADADTVFIRVCDRGRGIDPGDVERAFEKFWRADRDGQGRGGVGLGLFLVRRLVERQNGWVSLRPREGGGTIAEVRLPRADGGSRAPIAGKA